MQAFAANRACSLATRAQVDACHMAGRVAGDARPGVVARLQRAFCAAAQAGVGGSHLRLARGAHIVAVSSPSLPGAFLEDCLSPSTLFQQVVCGNTVALESFD